MSDILVSINESVADAASAARARRAESLPGAPAGGEQPRSAPQVRPVVTPAAVPRAPKPRAEVPAPSPPERRIEPRRLFADSQSLIRTVVASEVLGPPLALRRQNLWDPPGV